MPSFRDVFNSSPDVQRWFSLLHPNDRGSIAPVIDTVFGVCQSYSQHFGPFAIYITGSSLNLLEPGYNDIDLMVVIPAQGISKAKQGMLDSLWRDIRANERPQVQTLMSDPRSQVLGLCPLLDRSLQVLSYCRDVASGNRDALLVQTNSPQEVERIMREPSQEIKGAKLVLEGAIEAERPAKPVDLDGTQGYLFGPVVESFLKDATNELAKLATPQGPRYSVQWHKSFSEGYDKTAGENNCHILSQNITPVHLFLTYELDPKKAKEKKESFLLEYYTESERMQPVKIL